VEHVALAILAAQRVGIAAGIDEQRLVARCDLRDGEARGRRDFADDAGDLVCGLTESSFNNSTLRPIMPPEALISSTARSIAITAYSPNGPRKPVRGVRWPILITSDVCARKIAGAEIPDTSASPPAVLSSPRRVN
jgi:hypothetical protein